MNVQKVSASLEIESVVCSAPDEDFTEGTIRYTILELFRVGELLIRVDQWGCEGEIEVERDE